MTESVKPDKRAVIWQGYHHEWEYNHRVNRFGSYVDYRSNGHHTGAKPLVGHTAASGTGNDTAHFKEFVTPINLSNDVDFQPGTAEAVIECQRTELTPFRIKVYDLELNKALQNRDKYTVIINGFDLYAVEHSDKIITFDLEVTDPIIYENGTRIRFNLLGNLCFDCRSPECQLLPLRMEVEDDKARSDEDELQAEPYSLLPLADKPIRGIDKHKVDHAFQVFKDQVVRATNLEEVKRSVIGKDEDTLRRRLFKLFGKTVFLKLLKWRITTPYMLRVNYMIIAGDEDAVHISESGYFQHQYEWDLENEITRDAKGQIHVAVGGNDPGQYAVNTLAFKHMSMQIAIDEKHGTEDPIQWGKGMHFLEWSFAIRDIQPIDSGVTAYLDLFYKSWSEAMNEVITLTTWGAFRGAGRAIVGARLTLLQFKDGHSPGQIELPGKIYWPGRGLSAVKDPRARYERSHPSLEG